MSARSTLFRQIAVVTALPCVVGCGAATMFDLARAGETYASRCDQVSAAHDKAVRELDYLRPDFKSHSWSAEPRPNDDGLLSEAKVMGAIGDGDVRALFVQARGGIGKTQFGHALHAAMCRRKAAFVVDMKDIAKAGGGEEAIYGLVAAQIGGAGAKDVEALATRTSWMIIIDSLDEVRPADRGPTLQTLARMRRDSGALQVVFLGRPSIYDQYYGLDDLDGVLEIAPLDCGRARSALLHKAGDKADADRASSFVSAWGLDRQAVMGTQCYYPLMSTYRDLEAILRLARTYDGSRDHGGAKLALADVHEAVLAERLRKELAELHLKPEEAFAAVDRMIAKDCYVDGEWNLGFSVPRCIAAEGGDTPRNRHLCEELFQSVLFERVGGHKGSVKGAEWAFGHQSIADLFVARWIDAAVAKAGNCAPVTDQAKMFPGKEVAGYLASRSHGHKCVGEAILAACGEGAAIDDLKSQLRTGLPAAAAQREAAIAAARTAVAGKGSACADDVVKKL